MFMTALAAYEHDRKLIDSMRKVREEQELTFESIDEMYSAVNGYLKHLSDRDVAVLQFIADHARSVIGVAKLLNKTIQEGTGLSHDQVKRAIASLRKKGILAPSKQDRKRSQDKSRSVFGASFYVILPPAAPEQESTKLPEEEGDFIQEVPAYEVDLTAYNLSALLSAPQYRPTDVHHCEEPENQEMTRGQAGNFTPKSLFKSFSNSSFKKSFKRKEVDFSELELDKRYASEAIPEEIVEFVGNVFNNAEQIEIIWDRVCQMKSIYQLEEISNETVKSAFKVTYMKMKNKKIRNGQDFDAFCSYFWGTLANMVACEVRKQANVTPLFFSDEEVKLISGLSEQNTQQEKTTSAKKSNLPEAVQRQLDGDYSTHEDYLSEDELKAWEEKLKEKMKEMDLAFKEGKQKMNGSQGETDNYPGAAVFQMPKMSAEEACQTIRDILGIGAKKAE